MYFFNNMENTKFGAKSIEHAYLAILNDDLDFAKNIFDIHDSPRGNWGRTLVEVLQGKIIRFPTYFELRNFLEIDLDYLINNNKVDYTQMLLGASEIFIQYNQEVYKYIGRVLYTNRYYSIAKEYFDKSKNLIYKDAELHFLLAEYYLTCREYQNALDSINSCLEILPEYYPAINLKKHISKFV